MRGSSRRHGLWSDQRANPLRVRQRCRSADHKVEIGPAIDGKGRVFQGNQPGPRVPRVLGDLAAGGADNVVVPCCPLVLPKVRV